MPIPSVQRIAPAMLFAIFFFAPRPSCAQLQGKWECDTKSGQFDINGQYELKCAGALTFKPNRVLESTCSDGFFPSGTFWEVTDKMLTLRDSSGKAFADFEIKELNSEKLLLVRKSVSYAFRRG